MKLKNLPIILAILLLVWCFGAVAVAVAAELDDGTVYTEGTLFYTVSNDSITIVGCFGRDAEVTVPSMIAGTPVNTIARGAFAENSYVKTLKLPDTISKIERGAIADGIRVIYNANTDHPQDTPTELILSNMDPEPTETAAAEATATAGPELTAAPTDVTNETPDAGATATAETVTATDEPEGTSGAETTATAGAATANPTATATATTTANATAEPTLTPEPTEKGDDIGEWDIDLDETPTPGAEATAEPTATEGSFATGGTEPTAAAGTGDAQPTAAGETPADGTNGPDGTALPTDERSAGKNESGRGMPVWAWVLIGVAVAICVGGAIAAAVRKKK